MIGDGLRVPLIWLYLSKIAHLIQVMGVIERIYFPFLAMRKIVPTMREVFGG